MATMQIIVAGIIFNMLDAIFYALAAYAPGRPAFFTGWWIPGSGFYAYIRWVLLRKD